VNSGYNTNGNTLTQGSLNTMGDGIGDAVNSDRPKASGTGVVALVLNEVSNNGPTSSSTTAVAERATGAPVVAKLAQQTSTPSTSDVGAGERELKSANNSTELAIRPSLSDGCPGNSVIFNVDNAPTEANGSQLWNFGDGSFSTEKAPSHVFSKPGRYNVTLSYSTNKGGLVQKSVADVIVVHDVPEANFSVLKQEFENTIPSVHFENRSLGGATYAWDFGDGGKSSVMIPDHVYKKAGTYQVRLEVTNRAGCSDHIEKTVVIDEDYNLLAEKTFTPNADGREDTFLPEALKTLGVKFRMTVLNSETGQQVYETTEVARPWNGRVAGRGEACPAGDYIWMVEMKNGEMLGGTYNGTVSLLR
ncbi:MAG TPA: PKD domain-containing protein, partial [Flavobacteriales bacterium]|nr:PKD domain-containing protein [Flavobacteriales bacterium]